MQIYHGLMMTTLASVDVCFILAIYFMLNGIVNGG